ncbi:MAG: hypothetical protein RLZZ127_1028 [Planctomycetota bacterium]|jgi:hypothetical protein
MADPAFQILGGVAAAVALAGLALVMASFAGRRDGSAASRRFVLRLAGASLAVLGGVLVMVAVIAGR